MTTQANATCGASTAGLLSATTGKVKMALLAIEELTREREQLSALTGAIRVRLTPPDDANPPDMQALLLCEVLDNMLEGFECIGMAEDCISDALATLERVTFTEAQAVVERTGTAAEETP